VNRVLHDAGLYVGVFDLVKVAERKMGCGDGFLWYKGARFNAVVMNHQRLWRSDVQASCISDQYSISEQGPI
jgi:hypothetical protein